MNNKISTHKSGRRIPLLFAMMASISWADNAPQKPLEFDSSFNLQGITFRVICTNDSSLNQLEIIPAGLEIDNTSIRQEIDGQVSGVEIADLNGDKSPEIYVYVTSAGSGSYGSLVAYSANNKKSLSSIYLPPIDQDPKNSQGYMGHDQFAIANNRLIRKFPLYGKNDTNNHPTAGTRELQYKLVAGEASWILKLDESHSYPSHE